MIQLHFDNLFC